MSEVVQILADSGWRELVAEPLADVLARAGLRSMVATADDRAIAASSGADAVVLVSSTGAGAHSAALERVSFSARRPSLTVARHGRHLRIGPVVIPPAGPCENCLVMRLRQHGRDDGGKGAGGEALAPGTAAVAIGVAAEMMAQLFAGAPLLRGRMVFVSLDGDELRTERVSRVPACPRCDDMEARRAWMEERCSRLHATLLGAGGVA